ncbi:hypothetical protein SULI_05215 [Saccharolobus solfataricus]|uniref:Uncharacterized protein n=2 Tax=Saccharolobus solfataricus TaxID=2287 RepID=A0A0E3GWB7_SACSO|nr:hypothetical protein [Saccharolobus solfataricus]AKA78791.1 hypothetical protein SULA_1062 [Saccharolobus solfataricus]AYN75587.1 hypothetical protein SULB_03200 [Saccharolobus solfataricus]AYN75750.1 hypothetical protein SULC_03195 [Saccharolobus solfataricus]AZF67866.1 hypothetical protein SULG_05215 [Saccharolobus solfataricus]AZF70486.1 hypothetical protein SULH_05215 [Saccharolobus solfataricus]
MQRIDKSMAISGIVILSLSLIMLLMAIFSSSMLAWLAPEPRYYIPTLGFIISSFLLACCKTTSK